MAKAVLAGYFLFISIIKQEDFDRMITRILVFLICTITVSGCCAQILPVPGAKLNYTQVMFEYGKVKGADLYVVQVQVEDDTAETPEQYCSIEQTDSATATMISDLEFGKKYVWRYAGIKNGQPPVWIGPYRFETTEDTLIKKNIMSLVVTQNDANASAGGLIVNDCTHTIVDRNGKLVWYLTNVDWKFTIPRSAHGVPTRPTPPNIPAPAIPAANKTAPATNTKFEVRPVIYDLRVTPYGTITDMEDSFPIERDLSGNVLWKAPNDGVVSGNGAESYNHDFKRLPNGHYMVLGNALWRRLPAYQDTLAIRKKYQEFKNENGVLYGKVEFGTVIEYDKKGKVVWSWNSEQYFDSDALKPIATSLRQAFEIKPHVNAFGIDKNNQYVYVGFRDVSRIVKVEKATGKVVDSWGQKLANSSPEHIVNFHQQHDANIMDDGNIAIFNNNDYPGRDSIPSVLIFSQQPVADSGNIIWKFNCGFDGINKRLSRTGGNVDLLPNGNFLVCLGNLDKIFEVTRDKQVVWMADIKPNERRSFSYFHRLYRVHYVSSLYPCYFTFQTNDDTVKRKSPQFNFRLFNKGSEKDSYVINVSSASGQFTQQITCTLQPGLSQTFAIDPAKRVRKNDKITVTVISQTNPDVVRTREVFVANR